MADEPQTAPPQGRQMVTGLCYGLAVAAACLCVTMTALIAHTWWQSRKVDPLDTSLLERMRARVVKNPKDAALAEEYRDLDLRLRKTFFTNRRQLRRGAVILLISVGVLILALKLPRKLYWRELASPVRKGVLPVGAGVGAGAGVVVVAALIAIAWGAAAKDPFAAQAPPPPPPKDVSPRPEPPVKVEKTDLIWPAFRGPNGLGIAKHTNAPTDWDGKTGRNVLWKVAVPRAGYSSPVVWGKRLFLTGGDKDAREVFCFDTEKGDLLWRKTTKPLGFADPLPNVTEDTGFAAPSVAVDGARVFATFATGELVAHDFKGNYLWGVKQGVPENHYGHSSSLLAFDGRVYVQMDDATDPRVSAFDAATGKQLWETERKSISWASPIAIEVAGQKQLILVCEETLDAYDPATGKRLWQAKGLGGETGPSAAYADGMVFSACEGGVALGVALDAKGLNPKTTWEWSDLLPDTASPLAADGRLYLASSGGTMFCLDARKGKVLWEHEFKNGFYASPLLVGDKVYVMDLEGTTQIFKHSGTFELVASPALGERSAATPAILDGRIYVRGMKHLYCIGAK